MMEYVTKVKTNRIASLPEVRSSNDNRPVPLSAGRSLFPEDAVACIYKPSRSVMTSGRVGTRGWRLRFERRSAPFIEPLMGWTGSDDTLSQVELSFPTLTSAIRYAKRQKLRYVVQPANGLMPRKLREALAAHAYSESTLERLGLGDLQESYGRAMDGAESRNDPSGPETWISPMAVVHDATLSLDAKRSILINWAYTEYLIDQATNEGMPENDRPSRLDEVEQALLALERQVAADQQAAHARQAA